MHITVRNWWKPAEFHKSTKKLPCQLLQFARFVYEFSALLKHRSPSMQQNKSPFHAGRFSAQPAFPVVFRDWSGNSPRSTSLNLFVCSLMLQSKESRNIREQMFVYPSWCVQSLNPYDPYVFSQAKNPSYPFLMFISIETFIRLTLRFTMPGDQHGYPYRNPGRATGSDNIS